METVTFPQRVRTAVPGPLSAEAHARRNESVSASVASYMPVYIDRAEGSVLTDLDGNEYIDFGSGIGVNSLGHGNKRAVEAAIAQTNNFIHTLFGVTPYEQYVEVGRPAPTKVDLLRRAMEDGILAEPSDREGGGGVGV